MFCLSLSTAVEQLQVAFPIWFNHTDQIQSTPSAFCSMSLSVPPQSCDGEWPKVCAVGRLSDEVQHQVTWPAVTQPESGQSGPAGGELDHGAE